MLNFHLLISCPLPWPVPCHVYFFRIFFIFFPPFLGARFCAVLGRMILSIGTCRLLMSHRRQQKGPVAKFAICTKNDRTKAPLRKGPIPLVKGRCREATEGIGMLSAARLTEGSLQTPIACTQPLRPFGPPPLAQGRLRVQPGFVQNCNFAADPFDQSRL